ncbi:MAG: AAA family ATPase [Oscillospiraceae bacterium]|nr:AAA family ATPase [Oscillospiraceae bacterium]
MRCGLLGEKLGHSYSPAIHAQLGGYEYRLYEKAPDELDGFLRGGDWDALNVTIPYKKSVMPYCTELSDTARRIGSVNTLVRRADGTLYGDNTDAFGFDSLLLCGGFDVRGKKALVLGSGGSSVTVCDVLRSRGAAAVVISRTGENNYENLDRHADAKIIVNTTPVGMYPNNGASPVELSRFPACEGVLDLIYNPARTALLLQAETRGIPCANGLYMLVAQAKRSAELFTGEAIDDAAIGRITHALAAEMQNVVLIGMPGCGKTTVAKLLAEKTGRPVFDADGELVKAAGRDIPAIFAADGEDGFRKLETQTLRELGKRSGAIIATGGGCVTRRENYDLLHQNGTIFWLTRDLKKLPTDGRPLSQRGDLQRMYETRRPLYEAFADHTIANDGTAEDAARQILEAMA